ncbi:coiled-coil domain-containing protein 24 [Ambystoma mexicanum]|uniref:coiled-coil domain-containing protein 24 n=1 Tax=Ambystoma mexicanum TaxID=8296 RepID=UPI0037E7A307
MPPPASDRDSGFGEPLEPPPSLWKLVEEYVPQSERSEIRKILGEAAVDLSLELHAEVETLLELLRELRSTSASPHQHSSSWSVLADPPAIKDMVKQEIRMLLFSVRQKARKEGRDENQAVARYNPNVVNFVMSAGRSGSAVSRRTSTIGRISGPEVPRRPRTGSCTSIGGGESRTISSLSTGSSLGDDLEDLKEKFNVSDIDGVVAHLQTVLEDECRSLEKDIAFLQNCLEEEHSHPAEMMAPMAEPSLTELKEERRVIEQDLQLGHSEPVVFHPHKTLSHKPLQNNSRAQDLIQRMQAKTEKCTRPSTIAGVDNRTSPYLSGARSKNETLTRLCSSARTLSAKEDYVDRPVVTHPKPSPPGTAKIRRPVSGIPDIGHLQIGDKVHRPSTIPSTDSMESPGLGQCMIQVPPGKVGVITMPSTPYLKSRLSHVKTSDSKLLKPAQSLHNSALSSTDLGMVFIPTPPSNHRPVGKPVVSSTSTASPNRRVKMLQSSQSS